ncbi:MAG TPA: DMT family transporter, partial [Gemmatimonadales bacterium]
MTPDPAPSDSRTTPLVVHAALLLVAVLFGANYVVAKVALREVTPEGLVVIRTWGTAAILFATLALWRGPTPRLKPNRSDIGQLFLYGLLGASLNQICFLEGLVRSTATNAGLMFASIPLLTLALAVVLRRERAT